MSIIVISIAACAAALLTFFSGFGLGTLLMPVVALFFPIEVAIAVTAVVHLANNVFKLSLVYRQIDKAVFVRFGFAAMVAAFIGAMLLRWLIDIPAIAQYQLADSVIQISPVNLVIGLLILCFVAVELTPWFTRKTMPQHWLPVGGVISGFFGGLSGHQGAFRSMFLLGAGLEKAAFVATGVAIAVAVDVVRLSIYGLGFASTADSSVSGQWPLVALATASAFAGTVLARRLLEKVTMAFIRYSVAVLLTLVGLGMISGLI